MGGQVSSGVMPNGFPQPGFALGSGISPQQIFNQMRGGMPDWMQNKPQVGPGQRPEQQYGGYGSPAGYESATGNQWQQAQPSWQGGMGYNMGAMGGMPGGGMGGLMGMMGSGMGGCPPWMPNCQGGGGFGGGFGGGGRQLAQSYGQQALTPVVAQTDRQPTKSGTTVGYSDAALKQGIEPLTDAAEALNKLRGVRFQWKNGPEAVGVVAQEVQEVIPEAVVQMPGGYLGVDALALIGTLVEAVKSLTARVEALET